MTQWRELADAWMRRSVRREALSAKLMVGGAEFLLFKSKNRKGPGKPGPYRKEKEKAVPSLGSRSPVPRQG